MAFVERNKLALFFLFNFIFILAANYTTLIDIANEWWSTGPYNHGLLGFGLALYIIYKKRKDIAPPYFNNLSLLLLCTASTILVFANLASIGQLQVLSLFLILLSLLVCLWGISIINKLLLPLMMIFLTLPIWNVLQVPLRSISTWVSFHVVETLNFEIIRHGYELRTPSGVFFVEEACSGLGFFLASTLFAVYVAQINNLSRKSALQFLCCAISIAIVANWIRIIIIIIVGSQTEMQHFIVQDHLTFGWIVFAVCFIPVIILANSFYAQVHITEDNNKVTLGDTPLSKFYLLSISAILIFFNLSNYIISSRFDANYQFIMPKVSPYTQVGLSTTKSQNWHPTSIGASSEEFSYFVHEEHLIQVYLANYAQQRQGSEMIFIGNSLFDETRWYESESEMLELMSTQLKQVNLITLQKNKYRSRLIAYWYLVDGRYVADKKRAKWYEVQSAIKGKPGATLIAIAMDYNNKNKQLALNTVSNFVELFSKPAINTK